MEIHKPDIYGDIELAGNPGTTGQVLTSQGTNVQAVWTTPTALPIFTFTSPSNTLHTIVHNLGSMYPVITVYDQANDQVIQPATIEAIDANTTEITFFSARAIAGTIIG